MSTPEQTVGELVVLAEPSALTGTYETNPLAQARANMLVNVLGSLVQANESVVIPETVIMTSALSADIDVPIQKIDHVSNQIIFLGDYTNALNKEIHDAVDELDPVVDAPKILDISAHYVSIEALKRAVAYDALLRHASTNQSYSFMRLRNMTIQDPSFTFEDMVVKHEAMKSPPTEILPQILSSAKLITRLQVVGEKSSVAKALRHATNNPATLSTRRTRPRFWHSSHHRSA